MLIQLQLLPFIQHTFFLPCSAAAILQTSKANGRCVKSLLYFLCFHGLCAVGLLNICMCYIGARPTRIVVKKSFLLFQNISGWLALVGTHFPVFFCSISPPLFWNFSKESVIQELRTRKNGLIKRFSRVGPIITHSRESSNSQRDPQDHAHP